jgi:hypothetical protein
MNGLKMKCQRFAQRIRLIGLAAIVFVVAPLVAWVAGWSVGNAVVFGTGVVVLLYTYETHQMRWQLVRQNEIAVQPLVLAGVEPRDLGFSRSDWRVILRNIGKGPALFIRAQDFCQIDLGNGESCLRLIPVDYIAPSGEAVLPVRLIVTENGKETIKAEDWNFVANLHPEFASETYEIVVQYEDIEGRKHWSKTQMGKGGIRLLDHGQERRG